MWEITKESQIFNALIGLLVGTILSLVYLLIKLLLYRKGDNRSIVSVYMVFSFVAFIIDFCLFFALTNGIIRYYIIAFEGVGFLLFNNLFFGTFFRLFSRIKVVFFTLINNIFYILQLATEKSLKIMLKSLILLKKLLKNICTLIYTNVYKHYFEKK